jgi:hypothetical protein
MTIPISASSTSTLAQGVQIETSQTIKKNTQLENPNFPVELFNHITSYLDEEYDQPALAACSKKLYERTIIAKKMQSPMLNRIIQSHFALLDKNKYHIDTSVYPFLKSDIEFISHMKPPLAKYKELLNKPIPHSLTGENQKLLSQKEIAYLKEMIVIKCFLKSIHLQKDRNKLGKEITYELSKFNALGLAVKVASKISSQKDRIPAVRSILKSIGSFTDGFSTSIPLAISIVKDTQEYEKKRKKPSSELDLNCMLILNTLNEKRAKVETLTT